MNFPTSFNLIFALISKLIDRYVSLDSDELNKDDKLDELIPKILLLETLVDQTDEFRYIYLKFLIKFGKIIDFYKIKINRQGNEMMERKNEKDLKENYPYHDQINKIIQLESKIIQKIVNLSKSDSLANHNFYYDILDFWALFDEESVDKYDEQYYPEE
jgi:hypothetical protein